MVNSELRLSDGVEPFSDEELTELALSASPDVSLAGARPISEILGPRGESTLPEWYMPAIATGGGRLHGWRRTTALTFIIALVVIEAFGLCSTYGQFI